MFGKGSIAVEVTVTSSSDVSVSFASLHGAVFSTDTSLVTSEPSPDSSY